MAQFRPHCARLTAQSGALALVFATKFRRYLLRSINAEMRQHRFAAVFHPLGDAPPGFLFAIILLVFFAGGEYWQIFPLRGLTSDNWEELSLLGKALDYLWHITLPVTASLIASFAGLTLLTKNSFLDEIRKQYVVTARAKGLPESRVLYGHVFRNAMLIVVAGFPAAFVSIFFGASLIIEVIFSLDGLGRLGFEAAIKRDYPVMFGTLYVFGLMGLLMAIVSDLMYVWIDPRIDFESRET